MFNMFNVVINITNNNCIYNSNLNTNKYNKIKNVNHEENKWKETHMSNQQQHKVLINKNLLSFPFDFSVILPHLFFTDRAATRRIRHASKNRHKSIGRTVCRLRRRGSFGGSTSPPRTEEKCSTRFIQKSSAHKMCPIRISDEEATTAPPPNQMQREKTATIP